MRTHTIVFDREGSREAVAEMDDLFKDGWESLEPTRYFASCGHFSTTLYLPEKSEPEYANAH